MSDKESTVCLSQYCQTEKKKGYKIRYTPCIKFSFRLSDSAVRVAAFAFALAAAETALATSMAAAMVLRTIQLKHLSIEFHKGRSC